MVSERLSDQIAAQAVAPQKPTPEQTFVTEQRKEEYKGFGQNIADVKAAAGTSSLTETIEQYAESRYSKDIVTRTMQKTGFLPSPASKLMTVAGAVSAPESIINPNVPTLFELGSKSPEFIAGRLTGEAMMLAGSSEVFSWVTKGTESPLRQPVEKWLMKSYEEQAKGAVDLGEAPSWSLKQKLVMKLTGITPSLARGEVSIPIVETVSKAGMVSAVPSGLPYTDIGWELTEAPRMGGVMITKVPTVTTPKALELFFGIGEELIPFGKIKGEGETLGFQKEIVKAEPLEKGMPSSVLEESYYPKVGGFDVAIKDVNVRGATSWTKWPTTRSLMEEQKLLPFVTQLQVTRMGITPYIPDMTVEASKGMAQLFGAGLALLPKLEPLIKTKVPSVEEPYEIQKLRLFPQAYSQETQKQRASSILELSPSLKRMTETLSVSALKFDVFQEPSAKTAPALKLDVPQMTKQIQGTVPVIPTPKFTIPSFPTFPTVLRLPHGGEDFSRLGRGLFGKWFKRSHAMPTEKQIMRELGFGTGKPRKAKVSRMGSVRRRGVARRRR